MSNCKCKPLQDYHVVAFSGGKDSTAMLLHMLELNMPVNEIIFCDIGVEFPNVYEHIDKVEKYVGMKITRLKPTHDYQYMLLNHVKRNGTVGYSFPDTLHRWCTSLKRDTMKKHLQGKGNIIEYIGIAADEPNRVKNKCYPLVEWKWTEADCLKYCYDKGFDWGGFYQMFKRLSCWCCPLKSIGELRKLRHNFPELWATLLEWQHQTWRKFHSDYSVDDLETRFAREDEYAKMQTSLF